MQQKNTDLLEIAALICLIISIGCILMGLYLFPALAWGWKYNVPEFIAHWEYWFVYSRQYSDPGARWSILGVFFIIAFVCGLFTYWVTQRREKDLIEEPFEGDEEEREEEELQKKERVQEDIKESAKLSTKLIIFVVMVFLVAALVEWLISIPAPE